MMAPLMNTDQDRSSWLTVEATAKRLGVSPATVKRRIVDRKPVRIAGDRSVEIEAEMIERPQGHEWLVRIKGDPPPISTVQERTDSEEPPALNIAQEGSEALTMLREAWAEDRALLSTLRAENADLRERVGRAEAAIEGANARAEQYAIDTMEQTERAVRAEAELQRLRGRRWYDPRTW